MMYKNNFVACLKVGGKVLREFKEQVVVPFQSEYTICLKNLNSVRASVEVLIDGTSVLGNSSIVLNPFEEMDLERSISNGNLSQGNRFKFIERTQSIEKNRGIQLEDGLIQIKVRFEKKNDFLLRSPSFLTNKGMIYDLYSIGGSDVPKSATFDSYSTSGSLSASVTRSVVPQNDQGITVPGSISEQSFKTVASFPLEQETHVIILKLVGETNQTKIEEPILVKSKPKCKTCGRLNKSTSKFCSECGTSLIVL